MTPAEIETIVVVGGSIAGATAAASLRVAGFEGRLTLVGDEASAPYSRVPLSKGVLAGTEPVESALLQALPDDVELMLGARARALDPRSRTIELADGATLRFDGLVIATGARARRLAAPGQRGELVLRTLDDAAAVAARAPGAATAIVIGGGFLGMEVASTLVAHGLEVTVVERQRPLVRLLGARLSEYVIDVARDAGVRFVAAPGGVSLIGDPVVGVGIGDRELRADLVISAVGDLPNVEWLEGSGLAVAGGVVADDRCRVAPGIAAAGDVVAVRDATSGGYRRTPHWTNAVVQGRAAAGALLKEDPPAYREDHYFWTEQFGLDVKIAGRLPLEGEPEVLDGSLDDRSALLRWPDAVVALNYRMPVARLKAMVAVP